MKHYQERRIPKTDFKFFVKIMNKCRTNEQGVFYDAEKFEVDIFVQDSQY